VIAVLFTMRSIRLKAGSSILGSGAITAQRARREGGKMVRDKVDNAETELRIKEQVTLIAAEEFALSMIPLLIAVNEVGGVARAISILKAAKQK